MSKDKGVLAWLHSKVRQVVWILEEHDRDLARSQDEEGAPSESFVRALLRRIKY